MKLSSIFRIAVVLALVAAMAWMWSMGGVFDVMTLEVKVKEFGALGAVAFMVIYIVAVPLCLPGSIMTMAAGVLFGPIFGAVYALIGASAGATVSFLIARYVAGDLATSRAKGRLGHIKEGIDAEGWRFVAFVRLVPLFPFNILNYLLGLSAIPLMHYVMATFICMIPGSLAYTYMGYAGREAMGGADNMVLKIATAFGLLAGVAMLPILLRRWKAHFAEEKIATSASDTD